jgi:hypothetical protein
VRRNWFIAAIVLAIGSIVVVALVHRLTEDEDPPISTAAWADSICTSLSTWRTSITSLADVGGGELTPESLREKLDEADQATSQLVTELRDLGPPDLEAGDQLNDELDSASNDLVSSFDTLKQGAERAADSDTPAAFLEALAALAPQFQALLDAISATVDTLRNANVAEDAEAELEQAFADASSCQELRAES